MNESTEIEAEVKPTEDPKKVELAIRNLFELSSLEFTPSNRGSYIQAKTTGKEGLEKLYNLIRKERILTAARHVLRKGIIGESIIFYLNKQAAYVARISFCDPMGESPLGPIRVEIKSDDPEALIDWLTPRM